MLVIVTTFPKVKIPENKIHNNWLLGKGQRAKNLVYGDGYLPTKEDLIMLKYKVNIKFKCQIANSIWIC